MQNCQIDGTEEWITYILRMIVLIVSFLACSFVAITNVCSKKISYWPFKLMFFQSIAECVDLLGALIFNKNSACNELCPLAGYIMHCAWITSFLCSITMTMMYYLTLKNQRLYNKMIKILNYYIAIMFILPILVYMPLFFNDGYGPKGWYVKSQGEIFKIFCGFNDDTILYFWVIPTQVILISNIILSMFARMSYKELLEYDDYSQLTYSAKKIDFVLNLPMMFTTVWAFNHIIRVFNVENDILYYPILIFNLSFELHLVFTAVLFYKIFDGFLKIDRIWIGIFQKIYCCRKKKQVESEDCQSSLGEIINLK